MANVNPIELFPKFPVMKKNFLFKNDAKLFGERKTMESKHIQAKHAKSTQKE